LKGIGRNTIIETATKRRPHCTDDIMIRVLTITMLLAVAGCAAEVDPVRQPELPDSFQILTAGKPDDDAPNIDPEFGLPYHNFGCVVDNALEKHIADHNLKVRRWIAVHGLPPESVKSRFVDASVAIAALAAGEKVPELGGIQGPDGRRAEFKDSTLSLFHPGVQEPAFRAYSVKEPPTIAWGPGPRVFARIVWRKNDENDRRHRSYQVDLEHGKIIQESRD
jgi:hypothetical protein